MEDKTVVNAKRDIAQPVGLEQSESGENPLRTYIPAVGLFALFLFLSLASSSFLSHSVSLFLTLALAGIGVFVNTVSPRRQDLYGN